MNRSRARRLLVATATTAVLATPVLQPAFAGSAPATPSADTVAAAKKLLPTLGDVAVPAYDSRLALPTLAPTAAQRAAVAKIVAAGTGARTTWNKAGTPRWISVDDGFLSGTSAAEPVDVARGWLRSNVAAFGLTTADVDALQVVRDHRLPGGVGTVLSFTQTFDGVPSGIGAILTVVVDGKGRVLSYSGDPVRTDALTGSFTLSSAQALTSAVASILPKSGFVAKATGKTAGGYEEFAKSVFDTVQYARKIAFPTSAGARAAYATLVVKSKDEAWAVIVDAATGDSLFRKSLVAHEKAVGSAADPEAPNGLVFENYPGAAKGGKQVLKSFGATPESPNGWVDLTGVVGTGITTVGNNANTVAAWSVPLVPVDQALRPVAPTGEFQFAFTDNWRKTEGATGSFAQDAESAATNLFYHHNRIHDEMYAFGFTETAGNFQVDNFGKGGTGGDPVFGGAQSGALGIVDEVVPLGRNNANMITLPDGIPGITNMYLWEPVDDAFEGLHRDGDYDTTIIQHEYSHGLSNRYVGGGGLGSLGSTQSGAMGEGWSDWYAMNDLYRRGLSRTAVTAAYVGDPFRGIRNYNYDEHPTNYGDYGYDLSGPEVHSDGEIWTATLWSVRTAILKAVGGDQVKASNIAEHMVTDGMPLAPPTPSMLDARDAIIKAAQMRYGSRYTDIVWDAFAKRGMGASAKSKGEEDTDPTPAFDNKKKSLNGTLALKLVNASAGGAVKKARVLVGPFEARSTPVFTTGSAGTGSASMAAGTYTITVQAPGYGIQHLKVAVAKGRKVTKTLKLQPNLASAQSGATIVKATSQSESLPAANAFDDSEATAWQTGESDTAYNAGPDQSVAVKLKKPATIQRVAVSVTKPVGMPRFASANKVLVQTSTDGKRWTTAQTATFTFKKPRPTVADQLLKTYTLKKPVKASFVRAVVASTFGDSATTTQALVSEVQVFGKVSGITPQPVKADKPVTLEEGSVTVGTPAQGSVIGLAAPTETYGVTTASWLATCPELPAANGVDAYIHQLPAGAGNGSHSITYRGDTAIGEWLLTFYDKDCAQIAVDFGYYDQKTPIPTGAKYAGFLLVYGGGATFTPTVTDQR